MNKGGKKEKGAWSGMLLPSILKVVVTAMWLQSLSSLAAAVQPPS